MISINKKATTSTNFFLHRRCLAADETAVSSPPTNVFNNHKWLTVEQDLFKVFDLRGCNNVQLVLAEYIQRTDTRAHEIIIGWTEDSAVKTVINDLGNNGQRVAQVESPGVIDCEVSSIEKIP